MDSHGSSTSIFHFTTSNSSYSASNFPILAVAIIGILATAFLLLGYYIFVIKCCLNLHQTDHFPRFATEDPIPSLTSDSISRGLDSSLIRLIPVIHFRKEANEKMKQEEEDEETQHLECTVCLSDFNEGEKLRVIPNCCHAFHIDCIDIWLQNNATCPVCRSSISSNSLCAIDSFPKNPDHSLLTPTQIPIPDNFAGNDEDYVVIEIVRNDVDDMEEDRDSDDECVKDEEEKGSSSSSSSSRSCFTFRGGGGSRNAVLPVELDS